MMKKQTQCQKILGLLSDNEWHSNIEIFDICNCWRVGARVWDLKNQGCIIEGKYGKHPYYFYRKIA